MKSLGLIFKELLESEGIDRIGGLHRMKGDDPFQEVAISILDGKGAIIRLDEPVKPAWSLDGELVGSSHFVYSPSGHDDNLIGREEIKRELSKYEHPYFIIDLMYWDEHTDKEKRKLALQLNQSYGLIRDYLWGERLVLTWLNKRAESSMHFPLQRITSFKGPTHKFLAENGMREAILLDPWAEKDIRPEDLISKAFIIGGIVDKTGNKKGATPRIGEELQENGIKVKRRRISLRGDTVGVPDRINLILEILLKMIFEDKKMEEAIFEVQPYRDARWRLRKELPKHKIKLGKMVIVEKELFYEYSRWLNIRWKDFQKVVDDLKFIALEKDEIREVIAKMSSGYWRVMDSSDVLGEF
ncbi:MAG: tRNA (adenine9-N1/guanine9-N1)-methyltransferase [Methanobacteriaceae archaeon]|nr:tRNA (adenine9-N1/guanine9-N1)-methyltransferase [Methanobacteriaceae archaeon]